jgi:hypothetical protein
MALRPCDATTNTGPGRPPRAAKDNASTQDGAPVLIDVLANDTDPDGDLDPTSLALESPPTDGTARLVGEQIAYTPNAGATGPDRFAYTVLDAGGQCASAQVTVKNG